MTALQIRKLTPTIGAEVPGVELFEVATGAPRSFPADTPGFERPHEQKGAKRLPNPLSELPEWLEDTRN